MRPFPTLVVAALALGALPATPALLPERVPLPPASDARTGSAARGAQQPPILGSSVPCAVPLRWRIAGVDPGFELSGDDARRAVSEAGTLWERAAGTELFVHDPERGLPVRFEFDDRQASLRLRRKIQVDLDEADRILDVQRGELPVWRDRLEAARAEYEERRDEVQRRTTVHNDEVARWNERGGAPEALRSELARTRAVLEIERRSLERQAGELRELQEWIRAQVDRLNRGVQDRNLRVESLRRSFPVSVAESGRYAESVRLRNGEIVSVDREIRVFRFADHDELVWVLAHELGHALGLGHAEVAGAVMSEVSPGRLAADAGPALHRRDVEMLRARCPAPSSSLRPMTPPALIGFVALSVGPFAGEGRSAAETASVRDAFVSADVPPRYDTAPSPTVEARADTLPPDEARPSGGIVEADPSICGGTSLADLQIPPAPGIGERRVLEALWGARAPDPSLHWDSGRSTGSGPTGA